MANRRSETVDTSDNSEEYGRLRRGKWQLKAAADSLDTLVSSVFEPLDEEKLKQQAMAGIREKAKERMKFEGVSKRQQELVIAEMNQVLEEQVYKDRLKKEAQAQDSAGFDLGGSDSANPLGVA